MKKRVNYLPWEKGDDWIQAGVVVLALLPFIIYFGVGVVLPLIRRTFG